MRVRLLAVVALLAAILAGGGTAVLAAQAASSRVFIGSCTTEGQFVSCSAQGDISHPSSISAKSHSFRRRK
jgi:hypothetical protein